MVANNIQMSYSKKTCQAVPEDFPVRLPVARPEVLAPAQRGEIET